MQRERFELESRVAMHAASRIQRRWRAQKAYRESQRETREALVATMQHAAVVEKEGVERTIHEASMVQWFCDFFKEEKRRRSEEITILEEKKKIARRRSERTREALRQKKRKEAEEADAANQKVKDAWKKKRVALTELRVKKLSDELERCLGSSSFSALAPHEKALRKALHKDAKKNYLKKVLEASDLSRNQMETAEGMRLALDMVVRVRIELEKKAADAETELIAAKIDAAEAAKSEVALWWGTNFRLNNWYNLRVAACCSAL